MLEQNYYGAKKKKIPDYLINIIEDYLDAREIILNSTTKLEVTAAVPQGSVLGSTL